MNEPNYLAQTADGKLHAYWTLEILLIDIGLRRNESVTLYERVPGRFTQLSYRPTTETELRSTTQSKEEKAS